MKLKEEKIYKGMVQRYSPIRGGGNHLQVEFSEDYSVNKKRIETNLVYSHARLKRELDQITLETNRLDLGGRYGNIISISDDLDWNLKLLVSAIKKLFPKDKTTVPGFISKVLRHYVVNEPVSIQQKLNHSKQEEYDDFDYIKSAQIFLSRLIITNENESYEFYIPDQTFHISSFFRNLYLATVSPDLVSSIDYLNLGKFLQLDIKELNEISINRHRIIGMSPNLPAEVDQIISKMNFTYDDLFSLAQKYCDPIDKQIEKRVKKELKEKKKKYFDLSENLIKRQALRGVLVKLDHHDAAMYREYKMFMGMKQEDIEKSIHRLEMLRQIAPKLGKLSKINQ